MLCWSELMMIFECRMFFVLLLFVLFFYYLCAALFITKSFMRYNL